MPSDSTLGILPVTSFPFCSFGDRAIKWLIMTPGHVKSLQDIISDIEQATAEDDHQRGKIMEKKRERDLARQRSPVSSPKLVTVLLMGF